jgi:hypothetical protein
MKMDKFYEALEHLSEEEVYALIDFNESMAHDARESCEYEEAKERIARAHALKMYLKQSAA